MCTSSPFQNGLYFLKLFRQFNRNAGCDSDKQLNIMLDLKVLKSALEQLEEERKIPKEKIIDAIEQALAAAYKKDYGKKGQIIRSKFDMETGGIDFYQVKKVVDDTLVRIVPEDEEDIHDEDDIRVRFNSEQHIMIEDARLIKNDVDIEDEIVFPLETQSDYGRIAAQTAKQVIIQRIREAERSSVLDEYSTREGEIISGYVQKIDRGTVYVDFNRATGVLPSQEQIPGEMYRRGERIRAYLYAVEESPRGITLRLSRTHPQFLRKLFEMEAPEIASGSVEIKFIAREPGSRSKIAVVAHDDNIDPVGSCVGQRGVRVTTVTNELGGEKIDIIPWSEDPLVFISNSLSPAKVLDIELEENEHKALIEVADDQLSLAIGKGGQNVRLAAKLTGWRIDIKGNPVASVENQGEGEDGFVSLASLKSDETVEPAAEEDTANTETEEVAPTVETPEETEATEEPASTTEEEQQ